MDIKLNGEKVRYPENVLLMDYLRQQGIHIPGTCKMEELDPYGACRLCNVEVNGRLTAACNYVPSDGDAVETIGEKIADMRRTALELMLSDHIGDCTGPCKGGCPANSDIQGYLALIAMGRHHDAVRLMKESYILPASLGRVCPAPCEEECRRNLVEEPLAIRQLKRYAADYDLENGPWMPEIPESTGKKVAIVGSGPAGLSCGFYLRRKGHDVTIYEAMPEPGGMLRYGIPEYRLPKGVLARDIDTITGTGIKLITNQSLGKDVALEELRKNYDSVFLAMGAWKSMAMGIDGEDLHGVMHGIDFLREVSLGIEVELGKNVLVAGGGNTAMDAARTARRMGAHVTLVYRRSRNEMTASETEVDEAEEEGIQFHFLSNPVCVHGEGGVEKVELIKMELGEPDASGRRRPVPVEGSNFTLEVDNLLLAIGQSGDDELLDGLGVENRRGRVIYDPLTFETNLSGVFCGGDLASGSAKVIEGIAAGRRAADMMSMHLMGRLDVVRGVIMKPWEHADEISRDAELRGILLDREPYNHRKEVTEEDYADVKRTTRARVDIRDASERSSDFGEVESGLSDADIEVEAGRCMSCGCMDAFECLLRDYSTVYAAKQDRFAGEREETIIDESHPNIRLDNNKCILCGRCVNLTHEITGEGVVDYAFRGFTARISTARGTSLGDSGGNFLGNFVDECPTGAFSEIPELAKPGPWETKPVPTVCNGCGMGCLMAVEVYNGMAVRIASVENSWNHGLVCDRVRFNRGWAKRIDSPMEKNGSGFSQITLDEARAIIGEHKDDLAIVLTPDVTNHEAEYFVALAEKLGVKLGAIYESGTSTATYGDILQSSRIKVDAQLEDYPLLGVLLDIAGKLGAEITDSGYDLAILQAPTKPEKVPTLIMHGGLNEVGLIKMGIGPIPGARNYLVFGDLDRKLDGFTMVAGRSDFADVILPAPAWIEREGKIVNSGGMELAVNKVVEGPGFKDILNELGL